MSYGIFKLICPITFCTLMSLDLITFILVMNVMCAQSEVCKSCDYSHSVYFSHIDSYVGKGCVHRSVCMHHFCI